MTDLFCDTVSFAEKIAPTLLDVLNRFLEQEKVTADAISFQVSEPTLGGEDGWVAKQGTDVALNVSTLFTLDVDKRKNEQVPYDPWRAFDPISRPIHRIKQTIKETGACSKINVTGTVILNGRIVKVPLVASVDMWGSQNNSPKSKMYLDAAVRKLVPWCFLIDAENVE